MSPQNECQKAAKDLFRTSFSGVIRIDVQDEDFALWVDGRQSPPQIGETAPTKVENSLCLWHLKKQDFLQLAILGQKAVENDFIAGRLRLSGDMSVMARLDLTND
ncbi:MAG: SCP2 sterol-binding domain-containing protein [Pseudomonadota bacterium]